MTGSGSACTRHVRLAAIAGCTLVVALLVSSAASQAATSAQAGKQAALSTTVSSLSVGYSHACAVISDGSLRCWGLNGGGQLGDGTTTNRPTPVTVAGIATATQVSAGYQHTCARLSDGTVMCWGQNNEGQLGIPNDPPWTRPSPLQVPGISTATQVAAGRSHSCANSSILPRSQTSR